MWQKIRLRKRNFFFKIKSYNSFSGSQRSLNYVQDSGKAQGSGQASTGYRKDGVQYKESLQERKQKESCHNCGKTGHWARECRSSKKEQLNMTQNKPKDRGQPKNKNSQSSLQDLLLVKARLNKFWQSIMIDTGASGCFIGLESVEKLKLDFEVNHVGNLVEIADGREIEVVGEAMVDLKLKGFKCRTAF